jgi:ribosome-associated protein
MDIRKLQRAIVDGLEDVKAQNITVFNTEHLSPLFERVIIASGSSNRQTKALASSVRETVKSRGLAVLRTEGEDNGEWIIVDCGAAVAHIMQPAIRDYYNLEEIWGGKAVRMKVGEVNTGLVKASEDASASGKRSSKTAATVAGKAATQRSASTDRTARGAEARSGKAPNKTDTKAATKAATKTPAKPPAKTAAKSAGKAFGKATPTRVTSTSGGAHSTTAGVAAKKLANRTAAFKRVATTGGARKTAAGTGAARKTAAGTAAPRKVTTGTAAPRKATTGTAAPRKATTGTAAPRKATTGTAPRKSPARKA